MRNTIFILSLAVVSLLASPILVANEPELIQHVIARSVPEASFKRISEYFDQKENPSGKIILRTQQDKRAGYYFIISLQKNAISTLTNSVVELHYIKEGENLHILETFNFPTPIPNSNEIWLGLTGGSNIKADESILAWKIIIRKTDGSVIDSKQSFLWK